MPHNSRSKKRRETEIKDELTGKENQDTTEDQKPTKQNQCYENINKKRKSLVRSIKNKTREVSQKEYQRGIVNG